MHEPEFNTIRRKLLYVLKQATMIFIIRKRIKNDILSAQFLGFAFASIKWEFVKTKKNRGQNDRNEKHLTNS